MFEKKYSSNDYSGYIPGRLGFPRYTDQINENAFSNDRGDGFDCRIFLSKLLFLNKTDKKKYIATFTDEILEKAINSLVEFRDNHTGEAYAREIEEVIEILAEEILRRKDNGILQAGKKAEKELRFALRHLSEDYITIPIDEDEQLILSSERMSIQHEYDSIVVSSHGVYIIECKNYKGELIRKANGVWLRKKDGRTVVEDKNPFIQVDYQRRLLKEILNEAGLEEVYVDAIVCIINPTASVTINGDIKYNVVTLENLLETIEGLEKEENILSDEDIECVLDAIENSRVYDVQM